MVKLFCDICGEEITDGKRIKTEVKARPGGSNNAVLNIEIMTGLNGTHNAGHFCKYCIIDAVSGLDDRPRAACGCH